MKRGISRRSVVMAGAALSAVPLLRRRAFASGQPLVRYNAASPVGAAQLKKFAQAVKLMSARDAGDPLGWTFQWFTHRVRGDSTKEKEIAKLPPAQRALAVEMWDTCQAHGEHGIEDCFLPWHRIYLYYFERIVRAVLNDASFTMPYWNYLDPARRALPAPFRDPADSSNPLYRAHRKHAVNRGRAIDEDQGTPSPLNPACLDQALYSPIDGVTQGFCMNLDQGLHASVHILVGDRSGLGDIQWAANDPIFWLHHANVDRLWAIWNARGGDNPADDEWRGREFVYADETGARVVARVGDFTDIATLGYTYDLLEPVAVAVAEAPAAEAAPPRGAPVGAAPPSAGATVGAAPPPAHKKAAPSAAPPPGMVASAAGPVAVGAIPVKVALNAPLQAQAAPGAPPVRAAPPMEKAKPPALRGGAGPKAAAPPPPAAAAARPARLYLVIRNLQARAQPGVLYAVYLDVGTGAAKTSVRLGTINFFDAGMAGMVSQKFASFDVTGIVDGNISMKDIGVTIAAVGEPAADAKPVIGEITLASG